MTDEIEARYRNAVLALQHWNCDLQPIMTRHEYAQKRSAILINYCFAKEVHDTMRELRKKT